MGAQARILTPKQMKCIYALARKGGLDTEALHAVVEATTGATSIKALTFQQAVQVIDRLKCLVGQESTHAPDRPSREQVAKIYAMAGALGWSSEPQRLTAWLEKRYHVSHPAFLRERDALSCIEAMKAMLAGGRGERKGGCHVKVDG